MKKTLVIAAAVLAMAVGSFAFATAPPGGGITKDNVSLYLPDSTVPGAAITQAVGAKGYELPATAVFGRTCAEPVDSAHFNSDKRADAPSTPRAMPGGASHGVATRQAHSFYT